MVVLHYIPSIDVTSGGLGSYMQIMTPELGKLVDLHVATHHTECELPLGNCTLHYISGTGINVSGKVRNEVCELIKNIKPDIIHINCCWTPLCAYFTMWAKELCRKLCVKIPVVYAPHGMLEPWIISHNYWTRKLPATLLYQKKALTCADMIHSTADSEMSNLTALGWNKNIVVIPNSVDTKSIKIKTDWTRKKKILFLSRVHQKKGINFIIEAAGQLRKELEGYTISIIGPGEERYCNYLKSLTEKFAVEDIVHIEGPVFGEDKFTLFRNSDLFLLPTHSENFGIVVAESLACGTPVITTKGTPWKELQSEKCGWWIDIGTEPLVNALRDYLRKTDDELREMGLRGRKVIEDKYSCESIAVKLHDTYKELTNTPLTVLHYIPRIDKMSGGLGTYMQHLSEELGKKCNLHILTHYDKDNLHLVNCDINYLSSMWPTPKVRKEFNNILDKVKPDIVHVNTCWLPLSAYSVIWAKEKGYKVILTPHGMLDTLIIRHNYWTRKMPAILYYQRKAVRSADVIHTTSKREQRILHSIGWNENIEIIPNGVNTKDISLETDSYKRKFILYLGRIHPQKGIRHLIEASAMIKDELKRNGYHIVIAGMGDENYISKLKDLSNKLNVSELIDFEGPVFESTKWSLFREASLFVLPSYSESFGIVVAEALMSKTPVITTQGTPWEEIEGSPASPREDEYGRCGWWIERGTKPLAKALLNFLHTNPDVLRRYGENGVKLISERYDCDKIVNQFMSLYKKNNNMVDRKMTHKVKLSTFSTNGYDKGARQYKIILWYFVNALVVRAAWNPFMSIKIALLRLFGAKIGKGCVIKNEVRVKSPWYLTIGNHVWLGESCWIDNLDRVEIGNNVCISQGAMLQTGSHDYTKTDFRYRNSSVIIRDGAWIGARSVVCPGVTVEENAVLTAGSVATHDLTGNAIYQGNPAEKKRERIITEQ